MTEPLQTFEEQLNTIEDSAVLSSARKFTFYVKLRFSGVCFLYDCLLFGFGKLPLPIALTVCLFLQSTTPRGHAEVKELTEVKL